jgi:hypothetical protein
VAGLNATVDFPDSFLEPARLLRTSAGTLLLPVHQGVGDTSFVMSKSASGNWALENIPLPPNRDSFGVFLANTLDDQDRLHVAGTYNAGGSRELWYAVKSGTTWTQHLLEPAFGILSTRMGHTQGAAYVAYSGGSVRVARVTDSGTVETPVTLPDSSGHTVVDLATHAQGNVVVATVSGSGATAQAHLYRRQPSGTWVHQPLAQAGASPLLALLQDDGSVLLAFQTAGEARFDWLSVMHVSAAGDVLGVVNVETTPEILVGSMTAARTPAGTWRVAYERNRYRLTPAQKDLVVMEQSTGDGWTTRDVLPNHADTTLVRGPMLLDGNTLRRMVDGPTDTTLRERVVCF